MEAAKRPSAAVRRQIAGKDIWNFERSAEEADFFTAGYSGRKAEEVVAALRRYGVRTLVDIRRDPYSRYRPEMSKAAWSRLLQDNGIGYRHVPQLGVPREIRGSEDGIDAIWKWYDESIAGFVANPRDFLAQIESPAAFMCTELDPHECHRHRMALAFEAAGLKSFDI